MATTVFTIANQKGGVGKTATAVNLSAALASRGVKTLLIDMDPQANATSALGFEKEEGGSIYGPLLGEGNLLDQVKTTSIRNMFLVPSEVDLAAIEIELGQNPDYLIQLRRCLEPVRESDNYRVIVIDCPPALGLLSMNALAAADYLLIALQCEYLAMEGLGQMLKILQQFKEAGINRSLELGGILMTMFDVRTNLSHQVVSEVERHFSDKIFKTIIPRTVRLGEAPSFGKTIFEYDPMSPGATAYKLFCREVINRFNLK